MNEYAAALAVLKQLDLKQCEGIEKGIEKYIKSVAANDVEKGAKILEGCEDNEEMIKFLIESKSYDFSNDELSERDVEALGNCTKNSCGI